MAAKPPYDRLAEVKEFHESKLGVKGLVDSGITNIPRIFHHPLKNISNIHPNGTYNSSCDDIPIIELSDPHPEVVEQIRKASSEWGFFRIKNHSIPISLLDRMIAAIKGFHELCSEEKMKHYGRGDDPSTTFFSNADLFISNAASWRDTLRIRLGPVMAELDSIPEIHRNDVMEWDNEVKQLSEQLLGLLFEGLGVVGANKITDLGLNARVMVGQYYPYCPEPNRTVGIAAHSDPGFITILLQDQVGGLQVNNKGNWIDVKPVHGTLVVNLGNILQILSNDEYISSEHRVLANPSQEPRVSVAVFTDSTMRETYIGPLPEVISAVKPAKYRDFTIGDFMRRYYIKELDGRSLINFYRVGVNSGEII